MSFMQGKNGRLFEKETRVYCRTYKEVSFILFLSTRVSCLITYFSYWYSLFYCNFQHQYKFHNLVGMKQLWIVS